MGDNEAGRKTRKALEAAILQHNMEARKVAVEEMTRPVPRPVLPPELSSSFTTEEMVRLEDILDDLALLAPSDIGDRRGDSHYTYGWVALLPGDLKRLRQLEDPEERRKFLLSK